MNPLAERTTLIGNYKKDNWIINKVSGAGVLGAFLLGKVYSGTMMHTS